MAQRRPKAAILGSRIGRPQTRSLVDEPARRLPPDKCPDLPAQGSTGTRAAIFVSPPLDVLAVRSSVLANYPQETPGALDLVAVSLGFGCPEPEPELDRDETHFDGTGRTHDMVVKSLLTLDQWT